jgi:tetratricopeptide (TPR) repeat protein
LNKIFLSLLLILFLACTAIAQNVLPTDEMGDEQILSILAQNNLDLTRKEKNELEQTADLLFQQKRFIPARAVYIFLLKLDPPKKKKFELNMRSGDTEMALGHSQKAMEYYETAGALYPKNLEPLLKSGEILFSANILDAAEAKFKQALKYNKRSDTAKRRLGDILFRQNQFAQALDYYNSIDPENFNKHALINILLCYRNLNEPDKLLAAAQAHPNLLNDGYIRLIIGWTYFEMYELEKARQNLIESTKLSPQNFVPYLYLARLSLTENNLAQSEQYLLTAAKLENNSASIDFMLAQVYYKKGDLNKARKHARQAIVKSNDPMSFTAHTSQRLLDLIQRR